MQVKNRVLILLFSANLLSACGDQGGQTASENSPTGSDSKNASGNNNCLLKFAEKYDEALTADMVISATGFEAGKMEFEYSRVLKNNAYHNVTYSFSNGRIGKLRGLDRELELPDLVQLSNIKAITREAFEQAYRPPTAEENKVVDQKIAELSSGNSGNEKLDEAVKKAESAGVDRKQIKETAGGLADAFKEIAAAYVAVDGVGDLARWNSKTLSLTVLSGGVQFELRVEVSNDSEKNKSIAIPLAKQILALCR